MEYRIQLVFPFWFNRLSFHCHVRADDDPGEPAHVGFQYKAFYAFGVHFLYRKSG